MQGGIIREFKLKEKAESYLENEGKNDDDDDGDVVPESEYYVKAVYDWTIDRSILKRKKETYLHGLRIEVVHVHELLVTESFSLLDHHQARADQGETQKHETLYFGLESQSQKHSWIRFLRAICDDRSREAREILEQKQLVGDMMRRMRRMMVNKTLDVV